MGRKPASERAGWAPRTRLEEIRLARGVRSSELARLAGMDPQTLWRLETAKRSITNRWRSALASALMVSDEQLYAPIGSPVPYDPAEPIMPDPRPYEPEHAMHAIGRRLRKLLVYTGLGSALALAQTVGATEAEMIDWMEGRSEPPARTMNRLANRSGVTLTWLYFGDETALLPGIAERLRDIEVGED
jgi:transcriptional regulator with XRE-family HTH domain